MNLRYARVPNTLDPISWRLIRVDELGMLDVEFGVATYISSDPPLRLAIGGPRSITSSVFKLDGQVVDSIELGNDGTLSFPLVLRGRLRVEISDGVDTAGEEFAVDRSSILFYEPTQFKVGSLSRHIGDFTDQVFSTPRSGNNNKVWTSNNYNALALSAARNPSNPVSAAVNTTAFTAAVEGRGASFPLTLITPRHVVCAAHIYPGMGKLLAWVDSSGVVWTARIVRSAPIPQLVDTRVAYLDQALPSPITPASIFPPSVFSKSPSIVGRVPFDSPRGDAAIGSVSGNTPRLRYFVRRCMSNLGDRYGWVASGSMSDLGVSSNASHAHRKGNLDLTSMLASYTAQIQYNLPSPGWVQTGSGGWGESSAIGGESGNQVFTCVNGETVILFHYYSELSDGGRLSGSASILNPVLNSLKDAGDTTVYAMKEVDLSMFPDYV